MCTENQVRVIHEAVARSEPKISGGQVPISPGGAAAADDISGAGHGDPITIRTARKSRIVPELHQPDEPVDLRGVLNNLIAAKTAVGVIGKNGGGIQGREGLAA